MINSTISKTVFGKYSLSYSPKLVKDAGIDSASFDSLELLHRALNDCIKKELLQAIEGYLKWRTNRFQFISIRMEWITAIDRLKKALAILPGYSVKEICRFILADNGIIDLMLAILPHAKQKTYGTAFKKVEELESYATYLLQSKNPLSDAT